MLRKLTKREIVLLSIFSVILFVTLFVNGWLSPYLNKRDKLMAERELLRGQWEEIQRYQGQEQELRQSIIKLEHDISVNNAKIPTMNTSHLYWEGVLQKAKGANVKVVLLQEGEWHQDGKVMTSSLSVTGSQEAIIQFLKNIKGLPYFYAINEGSLTKMDNEEYMALLSLNFPLK